MKTTQTVEALLRPVVTGMGYELDEVEFQKEQGNWVLTLYIEHQDGRSATIDDCETGRSGRKGTISAASAAPLR